MLTVVFYFFIGEGSEKYVRPALEMEERKEEQKGVVRCFVAEVAGARDIHRCVSAVYGEHCMLVAIVRE